MPGGGMWNPGGGGWMLGTLGHMRGPLGIIAGSGIMFPVDQIASEALEG